MAFLQLDGFTSAVQQDLTGVGGSRLAVNSSVTADGWGLLWPYWLNAYPGS